MRLPALKRDARWPAERDWTGVAPFEEFFYELLDAHADTASLAASLASDPAWAAHLDYLRSLQRAGRALLARPSVTRPSRRLSR
jgi:hypothetical protein